MSSMTTFEVFTRSFTICRMPTMLRIASSIKFASSPDIAAEGDWSLLSNISKSSSFLISLADALSRAWTAAFVSIARTVCCVGMGVCESLSSRRGRKGWLWNGSYLELVDGLVESGLALLKL